MTVTLTLASGMFVALAWITVDPPDPAIPVIGTATEFAPARIVTIGGTVA